MWGPFVPFTVKFYFPPGDEEEMGEVMFWLHTNMGKF